MVHVGKHTGLIAGLCWFIGLTFTLYLKLSFLQLSMLFFSESKLECTFSVYDKLNSTSTIWHYKFSIYYKSVIVIDLVYAQHVTEEH